MALEQPASPRWHEDLALLALHSPGNIAYRALARICDEIDQELRIALWRAAARLANGIRTLFNRMDVHVPARPALWARRSRTGRSVLQYCADGNLQSVLDEYCFQLKLELAGSGIDANALGQIADRAVEALTLRTSRYNARATDGEFAKIPITVRFALRYGGAVGDSESVRAPEVRNAFNSPFWPFVLASTSVGQEGIDFHWWSHSVVHWNLPSNPVDFEQREGRVNRFGGHAVRKNVASAHGRDALASARLGQHPWQYAFDAAVDRAGTRRVLAVVDLSGRRPSRAADRALPAEPRGRAVRAAPGLADAVSHDARSASAGGHDGVAAAARRD